MRRSKRILALFIACIMVLSWIPVNVSAVETEGAAEVGYEVATEGIVLLKNEKNVLPISDSKTVSIFGRTQVDTIRGGTGSGNVSVSYSISILEGIKSRGDLKINEALAAKYEAWCSDPENAIDDGSSGSLGNMGADPSNPEMPITRAEVNEAAKQSDIAIIVIGRNTGEGGDHEAVKGDYYLSADEERLVEMVTRVFDKVVAIMNTGAAMDLSWAEEYGVESVLMGWQGGNEGGHAVADVLSGKVNPSGKLTDTYAISYDDYPAGDLYSVVDSEYEGRSEAVYAEDIFVGYRYFETFAKDRVLYPFGYGLSYTTFEKKLDSFSATDSKITVKVKVTNTGTVEGKDVVEVYYSAPQGQLGKAAIELAAYGKTDTLKPGQSQVLTLTYDTDDMASYDDAGKVQKSAWVLEAGGYDIYFGSDVRNIEKAGTYTVSSLRVTEQLTEQMAVETDSAFQRLMANGSYETVPTRTTPLSELQYDIPEEITYTGDKGYKLVDVYKGTVTMEQFVAQLSHSDLVYLTQGRGMDIDFGGFVWKNLPDAITAGVAGGYGYDEGNGTNYGIPAVSLADGPAGVRIASKDVTCTQFPMGMMVASTWNDELIEQYGQMFGQECLDNNVDGILCPALNIHRDPLLGRSFEYYSEDPLVTGVTAAAFTRGMQSKGVGVTLKHFALNNEEDNRMNSNSIVSERAIREIYLRGFEIAVKTADPWYIMSSYNLINGSHAASNYELLTNILRKEWGFKGTVMTDWIAAFDNGTASMVRAQNDLQMPGSMPNISQSNLNLTTDVEAGKVTVAEAQRSVINILNSAIKSVAFSKDNGVTDNVAYTAGSPWFAVSSAEVQNEIVFTDVKESDWFYVPVSYVYFRDIMRGVYSDKFEPGSSLSRAMMATVLYRLAGEPQVTYKSVFSDVPSGLWYSEAVVWASQNGIVQGYGDGIFGTNDNITREQIATMMYRYAKYEKANITSRADTSYFTDASKISSWADDAISWAVSVGLIEGMGNNTLDPKGNATRAQCATILMRYMINLG